jgi:ABC-2 type transport system ATP-binding protein
MSSRWRSPSPRDGVTDLVIETHGLRKQFGAKTAVEDLSLGVRRGEVFGFLGPNGAGKTTSVKMLLGLIDPTSGSGSVLGAPLGDRKTRARLGFLPEHFRFQDWLTGRELLLLHGRLLGMRASDARERADGLLARVDLLDAGHRPIRTYSKGMMQRAGLAQALLGDPEIVFLDEPTSGLDPLGRLLVRDVIRELRDRGTTVFLNSHLLGEVEATCSRVTFVKEGRTLRDLRVGESDGGLEVELRAGNLTEEAREAIARVGRILDGDAPPLAPGEAPERVRVSVATEDLLPGLAGGGVGGGIPLYEMRVARKSLETSFLEIMGEDQRPG